MHVRLLVRLLLLALLGAMPAVQAAQPAAGCRPDDRTAVCRYATGVLWKIERAGHKPSHLFGTIHLDDPRVTTLPAAVSSAFDAARSFTMEMIIDGSVIQQMMEASLLREGRTLDAIVGAERYAATQRAYAARGLPTAGLNRMQPWLVATTLMTPVQMNFLDLQLHAQAQRQQKPVHGLESVQEQIGPFADLPLDDQLILLDEALRAHPHLSKQIEDLTQAYLARDLAGIGRLMQQQRLHDARLNDLLTRRLLTDRNKRMVERMRARLDEGNAFIAVGIGHLGGEDGLLALLERAGWRVTPAY